MISKSIIAIYQTSSYKPTYQPIFVNKYKISMTSVTRNYGTGKPILVIRWNWSMWSARSKSS